MFSTLKIILKNTSQKRRFQLGILIFLTLFSSLLEVFSMGAIFPFVSVFLDPSLLLANDYFKPILNFFQITEARQVYLPLTTLFFCISTISYLIKILLIYVRTKLARLIVHEISTLIYWRIINESYQYHTNQNSANIITGLNQSFGIAARYLIPILKIINSFLLIFFVLVGMLVIDPIVSLTILGGLIIFYLTAGLSMNNKLQHFSSVQNENSAIMIKLIQESLGAIKMLILNKTQFVFYKNFASVTNRFLRSISVVDFVSQLPKLIFEYLVILSVIILMYNFNSQQDINFIAPLIITFVFAIQKLLPEVNALFTNFVKLKSNKAIVRRILDYININEKFPNEINHEGEKVSFVNKVELNNIEFKYDDKEKPIFSKLNISINKGQIVGIIGDSGSGKSTLIDIISGLITPQSGDIFVDEVKIDSAKISSWRNNINVVSQDIFLFDSTIRENITFNNEEKENDHYRLIEVCRIAELVEFIENLEDGYDSRIGEKGVKISGGQIQRIGIARALYNSSEILILDEATSALDEHTERKVMKNIIEFSKDKTLIIIAHRLSTLKNCDIILKLDSDSIKNIEGYKALINSDFNEG